MLDAVEEFGLIKRRPTQTYYDGDDLQVAALVAEFAELGLEPRHLRHFGTQADREASLVEQIVSPRSREPRPGGRGARQRPRSPHCPCACTPSSCGIGCAADAMREVEVVGVRVEMPTNQPLVLLRELEGDRYLPIWIGAVEASAIAFAQQGTETPRPLTHELMQRLVAALGDELREVRIDDVDDGVFYATLPSSPAPTVEARPSDSIALALRSGSRILCAEDVLDDAGITSTREEDEEIEKFREFLDEVEPEDFEAAGGMQPSSRG